MKKSRPKPIPESRLLAHFGALSPGEAVYCLESRTKAEEKCCKKLIAALRDVPATSIQPEFMPPLM